MRIWRCEADGGRCFRGGLIPLLGLLLVLGALVTTTACSSPGGAVSRTPTSTMTPPPSPTPTAPTATATATPASTPTATATPVPTPDPATLLAAAEAGIARVRAHAQAQWEGATLICLRHEDTDIDGAPEWVAVAHQAAEPPRTGAFVLDGEVAYPLAPAYPKPGVPDVGLGQYPICELQIRDVNADGVPEIAVFGHAEDNETLLHLYAWEGEGYRRLGRFSGDAGVRFVDADGDLEEEIWEGYRVREAPSLAWHVIYTWEDGTYGWTADRFDWYTLNRPQTYPTHRPEYAVVAFYLALDDRDMPGAHDLLAPLPERSYEAWVTGYATTVGVRVGGVHTIPGTVSDTRARVAAMVTSWDNEEGVIVGRLWNTEWDTLRTEQGWRLVDATAEVLDEWVAPYWR